MTKKLVGTVALFSLVGLTLLLKAAPLRAEEMPLILPDAIAYALKNNGDLKALKEQRGIHEAAAVRAGLLPNPVLELEGITGAVTGSASENTATVGISQEFLTAGKREKRSRVAQKELEGFDSRISDEERRLKQEVKLAYYGVLLADRRLGLARKAEELNRELLRISAARFAAGEVAELDLNLAKVEAARAEGRKVESESELVPAQQRLLLLLGASPDIKPTLKEGLEAGVFSADPSTLKAQALEHRHDLKALGAEVARAKAQITLAGADRVPNVTAGVAYSRGRSTVSVGGLEDKSTDNLIGLRISFPIPLFDRNQAGIQEAGAGKSSAEARYLYARRSVEREVETALARVVSARKAVTIYKTGITPQLEENLKLVQEAYQLGEVGILSVIEEQKKLIEVNDGHLSALHGWNEALAKLEAAVGTELVKTGGIK